MERIPGGEWVEILHPQKAWVQDDSKALSVSKLVRGGEGLKREKIGPTCGCLSGSTLGRPSYGFCLRVSLWRAWWEILELRGSPQQT